MSYISSALSHPPVTETELELVPDVHLRVLRDGSCVEVQVSGSAPPPSPLADLEDALFQSALDDLASSLGTVRQETDPTLPRRLRPRPLTSLLPDEVAPQVLGWVKASFESMTTVKGFYDLEEDDGIVRRFQVNVTPREADALVRIRDITIEDPGRLLDEALARGDLSLLYLPRLDPNRRPIEATALLHYNQPGVGCVPVTRAQRTPSVRPSLDEWSVHELVRHVASASNVGCTIGGALVVSTDWLLRGDAVAMLAGFIECYRTRPERIEIGVEYAAWACAPEEVAEAWEELEAIGVRTALVGVGRHTIDLDELDLMTADRWILDADRVRAVGTPHGRAIVAAIASLATGVGAAVVAPGVDSADMMVTLCQVGCEIMEGPISGPARTGRELVHIAR